MKIVHLKTNGIVNSLGFAMDKPTFSWIVEDTNDTIQTAAQIMISYDDNFEQVLFDSDQVIGQIIDSQAYCPPIELKPYTRYYWKVRVWGETEHAESGSAWFETAKMDDRWQAEWITPDWEDNTIHPILYHQFNVPDNVKSARAYICGLGLYHFELNEEKVGDEYFTPYCNAYDQWLQYQTFDLTEKLEVGSNFISVMLGNGWYKGRYGSGGGVAEFYGDRFALICEIHITLENGDTITVCSDTSWNVQASPVIESDIFDGEIFDARISKLVPLSDESSPVRMINIDKNLLEARRSLPVRIMEEVKPVALIQTPAGETVLDMGQNMTGWLRFKTNVPSGTRIHLQFGEIMQNGNFFRENLREAKAEYIYIANGQDAIVDPYFTFFGFQYVKVSGWEGEIDLDDFIGCVVYSDMEIIGEVETSNEKVNQLISNAIWSQKGNFLDIPTDCPQRDERLGWTGDIQVFSGTACFIMDVSAFLSKYAYDLAKEQAKTGGMVPHIVPRVNQVDGGATAWGDVATILPWTLYQFYGDISILEQQFESMRAWVDYIKNIDDSSGVKRLWRGGTHFGDWLALDAPDPTSRRGGTPHDFIASAFYCFSSELVAKAADVLGKDHLRDEYRQLSREIKTAIQEEYFTDTGRLAISTQTGYLLTLFMDLAPTEYRDGVIADFITQIKEDNVHLRTGFIGTPYLCRVLSNVGANELAYQMLLNEDYPSWLYAINLGATTIWEQWRLLDSDGSISSKNMRSHSFNHYAYGSIVEWIFRDICGLNSSNEEDVIGFRAARIEPKPNKLLQWAKASYRSSAGLYKSSWRIDDADTLVIKVSIPFNASAHVILPSANMNNVIINGKPLRIGEQVDRTVQLFLRTGNYTIEYQIWGESVGR